MKRFVLCTLATALLSVGVIRADVKTVDQKFYGKVTTVDAAGKNITVFNKKRQQEASFSWDAQTQFSKDKNPIEPASLEVGQFLVVAYAEEGNLKKATKVTVRPAPFKKKDVSH